MTLGLCQRDGSLEAGSMILVVGGIKGGSGKSTVATNLAVMRARAGREVLLVDADEQASAADFADQRSALYPHLSAPTCVRLIGKAVRSELQRLATKYEDVIIDTGGRDTTSQRAALSVADCLALPFAPGSFDLWTVRAVTVLIDEMRTIRPFEAFAFLNRAEPRGSDNTAALDLLRESGSFHTLDTTLGTRKAFKSAAGEGLSVIELRPGDPKASAELSRLHDAIFGTVVSSAAAA
jgi:chromosome partitioning protein